jgi:hypothetical protein
MKNDDNDTKLNVEKIDDNFNNNNNNKCEHDNNKKNAHLENDNLLERFGLEGTRNGKSRGGDKIRRSKKLGKGILVPLDYT